MSAWDDPVAHIRALEAEIERLRGVVARVEALIAPAWRTNRGHEYDTTTEAFAAGRNDHIDRIRAALEDR